MKILRWIVGILVILCGVVFAIGNREPVILYTSPLPYTLETPLFLLLFAGFILGLLLGYLLCKARDYLLKRQIKTYKLRIQALTQEVKALRSEQALLNSPTMLDHDAA